MCRLMSLYAVSICALILFYIAPLRAQSTPSPLACALTRQGVNYHIACDVLRGLVEIKNARINDGQCETMYDYYQRHPNKFERLKRMLGQDVAKFDFQQTYSAGDHVIIYMMPCDIHTYSLETNTGVWGWYATGD